MIDGSSARNPPGKETAVMCQCICFTFAVGVLVLSYYDRPVVSPQVEGAIISLVVDLPTEPVTPTTFIPIR